MAQQIIDVSTPNDGLGDTLRGSQIKANDNFTELYNNKVDKVTGKDLSENDFTDADKLKLDNLDPNAEQNVQSDWNQNDNTQDDFIKNKPALVSNPEQYIDGFFVDQHGVITGAIKIGDVIRGEWEANRYIIAKVNALPYTDIANLGVYMLGDNS